MRNLSLRFVITLVTFCIGVTLVSVWIIHRRSQLEVAKSDAVAKPKIPADTLITLQRTGCYGTCPSYALTITADGTVVFNGTAYWVKKESIMFGERYGITMSKISQEQMLQLISEFEKANYFSLRDSYR